MALPESESFYRYEQDEQFRAEIDQLFGSIERSIDDFILTHPPLSIYKWHQNLPLWIIHWEGRDGRKGTINLGAASPTEGPALAIAIHAYRDDLLTNTRHGLPKAKLLGAFDNNRLRQNLDIVTDLLNNAIEMTEQISSSEFEELGTFTR